MTTEDDNNTRCRLCDQMAHGVGSHTLLGHIEVRYFECPNCGLLQTERPHWLDEAYSSAITRLDTGAIARNIWTRDAVAVSLWALGVTKQERCLDFGGGHGVFVRMMRDLGYDFRWYDRYAKNTYSLGFEGDLKSTYAVVTAFEVFEHLVDLRDELDALFRLQPRALIATTEQHSGFDPSWHYLYPETGQHVTFFSRGTTEFVSMKYGYEVQERGGLLLFLRRPSRLTRLRVRAALTLLQRGRALALLQATKSLLRPAGSRALEDQLELSREGGGAVESSD